MVDRSGFLTSAAMLSVSALFACSPASQTNGAQCTPGAITNCACNDGLSHTTTCSADGSSYEPCVCGSSSAVGSTVAGALGTPGGGGTSAAVSGTAGTTVSIGSGASAGRGVGQAGTFVPPASAGAFGLAGRPAADGGSSGIASIAGIGGGAGSAGSSAVAGGSSGGVAGDELAMLRQTCVDTINMYRAMLPSLKPLARASASQEACSDTGAQMDGDSGQAHMSARAGLCASVGLGSEDTCPGWGVGGFSGNATVTDALKKCLMSMWAEGEPSVGRAACEQDLSGCFEMHGHYLNMSDPNSRAVACSFYKMKNGMYWMNQDFSY